METGKIINVIDEVLNILLDEDCNNVITIKEQTLLNNISKGCSKLHNLSIDLYNGSKINSNLIKRVEIPYTVKKIIQGCFSNCKNLEEVILHKDIECLGSELFSECLNLKQINLDILEKVTSIPNYCFRNCHSLTELTLPKNISYIGSGAFLGCKNLKCIILDNSNLKLGTECFTNCHENFKIWRKT